MGRIISLDETDSTNSYIKRLISEGAEDGLTVSARRQTAGRGRCGNSFASAEGGLYMSVLFRHALTPARMAALTTRTAAAAVRAIEKAFGIETGIKWVNDILLGGRKLAGILVEAGHVENGTIPWAVIGAGFNVNTLSFPDEIRDKATSLKLFAGREFSADVLMSEMLAQLDELRADFTAGEQRDLDDYRRFCITPGREISFVLNGRRITAAAEGIDDDYGLEIRYPGGEKAVLRSGEVSVRAADGAYI